MWLYPMLRVETYLTPARLSASRVEVVTGVLWPTLMHRFPDASSILAADTAASVIVGTTPKRDATSRNAAASSGPHPYTVIPMLRTGEEDAGATDRARQAAGRAGSLEVMFSSQGSRMLRARMRFSIRRRYVAGRSVREHVTVHHRPPRRPGMIPLSLHEIAAVAGGTVEGDGTVTVTAPAVLDGRQAELGGLFVAFAGEHADGHDYAGQAGRAGAVAVLGSRPTPLPTVIVEDAQAALQALAAHVVARLRDRLTVAGLTGSQGKTSTKDLLAAVLSSTAPTIATIGSLNNELGVPLTMLRADAATRFLVLEMGARHIGDSAGLTGLAAPDIAVVLNVGQAHLGKFGSRGAIAEAKGELCRGWRPAAPSSSTPTIPGWPRCARSPTARCGPSAGRSTPTCGCSAWRWTGSAGRPSRCGPSAPRLPSRCRSWAPTRRSTRRLPWRQGWRPAYPSPWPRQRWPPSRCRSGAWSCAASPGARHCSTTPTTPTPTRPAPP